MDPYKVSTIALRTLSQSLPRFRFSSPDCQCSLLHQNLISDQWSRKASSELYRENE